ncbi:MAG: hypothetical protein ACI9FR_002581 [Cryomorphaceae bacterium]|jgi:hypothetical protein
MNFLSPFYQRTSDGHITVAAEQGSRFAKQVAGDYNPIHDPESRRFCVPGDLLFSLALGEYGLHKNMRFSFKELVSAESILNYQTLSDASEGSTTVTNRREKTVLEVLYSGGSTTDEKSIEQFLSAYVAFSGQNFPHILVPLMKEHNVMINVNRPMVIYESMSFELNSLEFESFQVAAGETAMQVDGRRGDVQLHFSLNDGEKVIGEGSKNLVLGGLREFDEEIVDKLCRDYLANIPA